MRKFQKNTVLIYNVLKLDIFTIMYIKVNKNFFKKKFQKTV